MPALLPVLRLLRVGTLFSPAADVVASAAVVGLPFGGDVGRAVLASACIYASGMVWNDVADRELDAAQRPERPLPSRAVGLPFAVALAAVLMLGGLLLSPCRLHHGLIAALVLAYDFLGKRIVWLGAFGMGVLRALNLGTALAIADAAAPARGALLLAAVCYGGYIVAVSVLGVFEDDRHVAPRAVVAVRTVPPLLAFGGVCAVQGAFWPAPALALVPVCWFLRRNARATSFDQRAIRQSMTWLLLGTMVYTALLALAAERPFAALAIGAAILPARWISRRIALT